MVQSFRVQFQHRLREHLARHPSPEDAFNVVWDRTLREVALQEGTKAQLYWELINWARSYDLFTRAARAEGWASRNPPRHDGLRNNQGLGKEV